MPSDGHGSLGLPLWLKVPGDGTVKAGHQCFMRCSHQRRLPAWFEPTAAAGEATAPRPL